MALALKCCNVVLFSIDHIIKMCMYGRSGGIPSSWKVSRIALVYKQKGFVSDPRSYYPIAILPYCGNGVLTGYPFTIA